MYEKQDKFARVGKGVCARPRTNWNPATWNPATMKQKSKESEAAEAEKRRLEHERWLQSPAGVAAVKANKEAAEKIAAEEMAEIKHKADYNAAAEKIRTVASPIEVMPNPGNLICIFVDAHTAYCRLIFEAFYPKPPKYFVANHLRSGLRAFFDDKAKAIIWDHIKKTKPQDEKSLREEGGILNVGGKLRIKGWNKGKTAVYVDIVELT